MRSMRTGCVALMVVIVALWLSPRALADADGAKKALETVKKNIAEDNMANIDQDIKMVDFELKDTPDPDKKAIQDELDKIKKKIHDDKVAKFRPATSKNRLNPISPTPRRRSPTTSPTAPSARPIDLTNISPTMTSRNCSPTTRSANTKSG